MYCTGGRGLPAACPDEIVGLAILEFRFADYPRGLDPRFKPKPKKPPEKKGN